MNWVLRLGAASVFALLLHALLLFMALNCFKARTDSIRPGLTIVLSGGEAKSTGGAKSSKLSPRTTQKEIELLANGIGVESAPHPTGAADLPVAADENVGGLPPIAVLLDESRPSYPLISRKLREQGEVVLAILVTPDGRAREVSLKSSSGHERLDLAAASFAREARYQPVPAEALRELRIKFSLE